MSLPLMSMQVGICPQHDTLWPTLTAREHLLFYTRIKVGTGPCPPPRIHLVIELQPHTSLRRA